MKNKKEPSRCDRAKRTSEALTRPHDRALMFSAGLQKKKTLPKKCQKK